MQKKIIWFWMHLKSCLKSLGFYIQLISIILMIMFIQNIQMPNKDNVEAALLKSEGKYAKEIINELITSESVFEFKLYDNEEEVESDVVSGKVDCAFIFKEDFDNKIEEGNYKKIVEYLCSTNTTKGAVMQESVYASFYRSFSRVILKQVDEQILGDYENRKLQKLLEKNEEYIASSDLFDTNIIKVDCDRYDIENEKTSQEKNADRSIAIAAIMTFLMMYLYAGKNFSKRRNIKAALNRTDAFVFDVLGNIASGLIPSLLILGYKLYDTANMIWIINGAGFVMYSSLWIAIVIRFMKAKTSYYASVMVIIIFFVLLSPVIVDVSLFIPTIKYIRMIVPVNILLI